MRVTISLNELFINILIEYSSILGMKRRRRYFFPLMNNLLECFIDRATSTAI